MYQRAKNDFFAWNSQAHVMVKPELLLSHLQQALKLRVAQPRNRDYVSASVFAYVHSEMPFRNIIRETAFIVAIVFLSEARTLLEDLLQRRRLRQ